MRETKTFSHGPFEAGFRVFHKNSLETLPAKIPVTCEIPSPAKVRSSQNPTNRTSPPPPSVTTPQHRQDGSRCRSPRWHKSTFNSDFRDVWRRIGVGACLLAYFDKLRCNADDRRQDGRKEDHDHRRTQNADLNFSLQYAFSRNFRQKGMIQMSTYLRQYKYVATRTSGLGSAQGKFSNHWQQGR